MDAAGAIHPLQHSHAFLVKKCCRSKYRCRKMTTDVLTQLQIEYNQLATQFFSTFSYLNQRHPLLQPPEIPGLKFTNQNVAENKVGPEDSEPGRAEFPLQSTDQKSFEEAQSELAQDLAVKTKQIQQLIIRLPGIDSTEQEQAEEVKRLAAQLEEMQKQRMAKRKEMRQLVKRLDAVVTGMNSSINT